MTNRLAAAAQGRSVELENKPEDKPWAASQITNEIVLYTTMLVVLCIIIII